MARQTYIVSDLTGEPITNGQRVILTLKFEDPTRPWLTLDASESDKAITSLISSARETPRRAAESGVCDPWGVRHHYGARRTEGMVRAVRLTESGLQLEQIDTPEPGAGDALVRVRAAAITKDEPEGPVDRLPAIPGYELSGEVAALGRDAKGVAVGDEVYALADFGRDGAAADFAVVAAALLVPKPRSLDHVASAAIPLAALSAWQGLSDHGHLEAGQCVLILGATGGVGHFATQLARHRGAHVIAAASDADAAKALGAHEVVDARRERIEDAVERSTSSSTRSAASSSNARRRSCVPAVGSCRSRPSPRRPASTSSPSRTGSSSRR